VPRASRCASERVEVLVFDQNGVCGGVTFEHAGS
jgi:hypothetical protein